jgi:hypothetical protein
VAEFDLAEMILRVTDPEARERRAKVAGPTPGQVPEQFGEYYQRREDEAREVWMQLATGTEAARVVGEHLGVRWPVKSDWDEDAVLEAIWLWTQLHGDGNPPTMHDWSPSLARGSGREDQAVRFEQDGCWPTNTIVKRMFGQWNNAIREAGFTPLKTGQMRRFDGEDAWSERRIVNALRNWADEHGHAPLAIDSKRERAHLDGSHKLTRTFTALPSQQTVSRKFGSWNEALAAAGLEPHRPVRPRIVRERFRRRKPNGPVISRELILEQLRVWRDVFGAAPTMTQWRDESQHTDDLLDELERRTGVRGLVTDGLLTREFGGFIPAMREAGLDIPHRQERHEPAFKAQWTRERIIEAIQQWATVTGDAPFTGDWMKVPAMTSALQRAGVDPESRWCDHRLWPTTHVVSDTFGTWNAAIEAAGFTPRLPGTGQRAGREALWTKERIIDALQRWHAQHGRVPTSNEWGTHGSGRRWNPDAEYPTVNPVLRQFGSWNAALSAAGYANEIRNTSTRIKGGWTCERIIESLRTWADENGRAPTNLDWQAINRARLERARAGTPIADDAKPHPSASMVRQVFGTWAQALAAAGLARAKP